MATPRIVVEDATGELLAGAGPVVFGTHIGCDVVVDDAIAAARHCEFTHDGTFTVRDLGSVSGTWVDGESVRAPSALKSGSQVVFGTSRVLVEIEAGDALTLRLKLQRQGFWWRKAGKKVFFMEGDEVEVNAGEMLNIPPHIPHKVEALEDSVAIDLFAPARDDWQRGDDAYLRQK